jgi:hypothetical protein
LSITSSDFDDILKKIKNEKNKKFTDCISSEFNNGINKSMLPSMKIIGRRKIKLWIEISGLNESFMPKIKQDIANTLSINLTSLPVVISPEMKLKEKYTWYITDRIRAIPKISTNLFICYFLSLSTS